MQRKHKSFNWLALKEFWWMISTDGSCNRGGPWPMMLPLQMHGMMADFSCFMKFNRALAQLSATAVYALGGFIILRWVWARWRERRPKNESSDEEPPPTDD
ncbi:hypothetical protein L1049_011398 [Liquidambar formosana]|uniref:Uncharacterized protein n=1 Tax=Liquidambar formosana TaxID=63359 RepID=A0AAP0WZS0_LIQFO